ncbi:MAG: hypothetical protein ACT4NV_08070, partial [Rhodoferax sp.]
RPLTSFIRRKLFLQDRPTTFAYVGLRPCLSRLPRLIYLTPFQEQELGLADWVDTETGCLAEGLSKPHLVDEG